MGRQGLTSTHQRCRQVCSSSELKVSTIAEANYGLSGNTLEAARHGHLLFTTCTDVARAGREWPSTPGSCHSQFLLTLCTDVARVVPRVIMCAWLTGSILAQVSRARRPQAQPLHLGDTHGGDGHRPSDHGRRFCGRMGGNRAITSALRCALTGRSSCPRTRTSSRCFRRSAGCTWRRLACRRPISPQIWQRAVYRCCR